MPGIAASNSSATVRSWTAEFCRRSRLARWKPNNPRRGATAAAARARSRRNRSRQRAIEDVEIGPELRRLGIGRGLADRPPCGLDCRARGGRGQARIDAGDGAAIRLVAAMRRRSGERSASARSSSETSARCAASDSSAPSTCSSSR